MLRRWRVFGLFFAFTNVMFRAFYIGIARTKVLTVNAVVMALFSAVSGTGNTRTALGFEIFTLVFYMAYMWWVIIFLRASAAVAWTTEHIYWLFLMTLSFIYLRSGKWKGRKI